MSFIKPGQIYKGTIGYLKVYEVTPLGVYYRYISGPVKSNTSLRAGHHWITNHTKLDVFKTFKELIKRNNES